MPPAARITDPHKCHYRIQGPITTGSPDVNIGEQPAARIGDNADCAGRADTINQGSPTVFINGRPAARLADATSNGGVIIGGCQSVIIGNVGMGGSSMPFGLLLIAAKRANQCFT